MPFAPGALYGLLAGLGVALSFAGGAAAACVGGRSGGGAALDRPYLTTLVTQDYYSAASAD